MKREPTAVLVELGRKNLPDVVFEVFEDKTNDGVAGTMELGKYTIYDFLRVIRWSREFRIKRKKSPLRGLHAWVLIPRNESEQLKPKFPKKPSKNWR